MDTAEPPDDVSAPAPDDDTSVPPREPTWRGPLGTITALIASGAVAKEDCKYVTDQESSDLWDRLVVEVAEIKAKGWMVDIVDDS